MTESNKELESRTISSPPISLYNELRLLLLAGVIFFSTGIGGLLYESRGNVAHIIAIAAVSGISLGCFIYGYRAKSTFSARRVQEKNNVFDFVILLGALTMLTAIAYLQFQFDIFGNRYGLATFIPMCILFFAAYYYDHSGVLGMAITNLAAWSGIVATPRTFGIIQWEMSVELVSTGIALAVLLELISRVSVIRQFKAHFSPVYHWTALNLAFIAALTGLFNLNVFLFTALIILFAFYFYRRARAEKSFAQVLLTLFYLYITCAYLFMEMINKTNLSGLSVSYITIFYFLVTAIVFAFLLIHHNKLLRK